ncbi:MAG TPA: DotU family type IV/VI secretion system protein [Planctomycetota bacterium]|nr:DotU family type IV/VI secretion system protein [Planctomycetota bacterium]
MTSKPGSLHEACTPIFLFLTSFRRNSETSTLGIDELRDLLVREIERVERACENDRKLRAQFERAKYALVAAADQVVLGSNWNNRAAWSMQLLEQHFYQTAEAGTKFFALVDELLADTANDAAEVAHVLFTCMALGFQGELMGDRKELDRRRLLLFEKARLAGALGDRLAPESYGRNSPRTISKLPTAGIMRFVLVALAALLFVLLIGDRMTEFKNRKINQQIGEQEQSLRTPRR